MDAHPLLLWSHHHRPTSCHSDCCGERPSKVSPPGWKACSKLPSPRLRDRHPLCTAAGHGSGGRVARRSGWHTEDHPRLPSSGEVRHAGWRCIHAQTGPEWDGDAEGQSYLGIWQYRTGETQTNFGERWFTGHWTQKSDHLGWHLSCRSHLIPEAVCFLGR